MTRSRTGSPRPGKSCWRTAGGGIVSIYYHPCEFVHKEFWDGVNFRNGANPPRDQWKLPPAKTAEESKIAYQVFEGYVRFIKRFPDVQFITASEAAKLYRDRAQGRNFTPAELKTIAEAVNEDVTFQKRGDHTLAASEIFALLNEYVAERVSGREPAAIECKSTPYGPSNAPPALTTPITADWSQFTRTVLDVNDFLRKQKRIPTSVWLGSQAVPPEAYLVALARVAVGLANGKEPPPTVEIKPAKLAAAAYVADDAPNLWGWVIFPAGFRARRSWSWPNARRGRLNPHSSTHPASGGTDA